MQAPWDICKLFDDVDDSTWCWEQLYKNILNSYVSTRKVKVRSKSLPWMNTEISKEMNKRYKLLKKAQKHPKSSELWTEYRKQRNSWLTVARLPPNILSASATTRITRCDWPDFHFRALFG